MIYFIDYENTHRFPSPKLFTPNDRVFVFLGSQQATLKVSEVKIILALPNVELVQVEGISRNNVDFHICYYLGTCSEKFTDDFTIVSNDKEYDFLAQHLTRIGKNCYRIPVDKPVPETIEIETEQDNSELISSLIQVVLKSPIKNRPRKVKTLTNYITKQLIPKEHRSSKTLFNSIIDELKSSEIIKIDGLKVEYLR